LYLATLAGAFTLGRTVFVPVMYFLSPPSGEYILAQFVGTASADGVELQVMAQPSGDGQDSWLAASPVVIWVYAE